MIDTTPQRTIEYAVGRIYHYYRNGRDDPDFFK